MLIHYCVVYTSTINDDAIDNAMTKLWFLLKNNIKNDFFFGKYTSATVYYYYHVK